MEQRGDTANKWEGGDWACGKYEGVRIKGEG